MTHSHATHAYTPSPVLQHLIQQKHMRAAPHRTPVTMAAITPPDKPDVQPLTRTCVFSNEYKALNMLNIESLSLWQHSNSQIQCITAI